MNLFDKFQYIVLKSAVAEQLFLKHHDFGNVNTILCIECLVEENIKANHFIRHFSSPPRLVTYLYKLYIY